MAVVKLEIQDRHPLAEGREFGAVGAYEVVQGTAHFAVDPLHHRNAAITDIELGPRDANGRVCFDADFAMLQPVQPQRGL